ncbi:DUF952 domain-containing protein [Sphingomonas nostoxanthinifaciens]|uniref:DUF952 domain-containing protein n=1 Tax=Sphingomonas nostoxanthinifaciens TaxID=2872652 RepID=UPI001CC20921|nr:DUF952 domain-containing protein [Sphingomonas nostoxanthinifaciens]UAK23620.1 DUF952 domain-containing protein [Sphingomonas nostoxanthinifaciens]
MPDSVAYKILTADQLETLERDGSFAGAPVDLADGYVHLSTAAQVAETLDKHFAGQPGLALAAVDLDALGEAVRWEPSRGGQLFPHLYAPMTLETVLAYGPIEHHEDGSIKLPVAG